MMVKQTGYSEQWRN